MRMIIELIKYINVSFIQRDHTVCRPEQTSMDSVLQYTLM